jgi:GH18 family chitinase
MGIKIIGSYGVWETAENVMRISGTADLRTKFSASVMDVMEQLQLDGLYFQWIYPGCPRVLP